MSAPVGRRRRGSTVGAVLLALSAAAQGSLAATPAEPLQAVVEGYWEAYLRQNPSVASATGDYRYDDRLENRASERYLADSLALERDALDRLRVAILPPTGDPDRLTRLLFQRGREQRIAGLRYPEELLCVDPWRGPVQSLAQLASGAGGHPFRNTKDYDDFLQRIDDYLVWNRTAIANLRRGLARGITVPRVLMEQVPPQLAALLAVDPTASPFFRPVQKFPTAVPAADRERLRTAYREAIVTKLNPALAALRDFLLRDYLPGARTDIAWSSLPMGQQWYAYRLHEATTTAATPEQLHALGQREVARLGAGIDALQPQTGFVGDRRAFFEFLRREPRFMLATDDTLQAARQDLVQRTAVSAKTLPRFRRFADFPAYSQGLALYAHARGVAHAAPDGFQDPYRVASVLATESLSAARLVVDTGIHARGWSRAQAARFLQDNVPLNAAEALAEVDRCIGAPGHALGYLPGKLKIDELRLRAEQRLGAAFDERAFHRALLQGGVLPLDLLEAELQRWLQAAAAVAASTPAVQ